MCGHRLRRRRRRSTRLIWGSTLRCALPRSTVSTSSIVSLSVRDRGIVATIHVTHLGFNSGLCAASFHGVDIVDCLTWRPRSWRRCDGPRLFFLCLLIYCANSTSGVDGDDHGAVSSTVSARSHVGLRVVVSTVHALISLWILLCLWGEGPLHLSLPPLLEGGIAPISAGRVGGR
jgi:hypothetical protein